MQPVPRIFVSATSRDLRTARGLVAEGLRRMECLPIVQDDFPPDYKSVRDMLRTKIQDCNAVVHLAGYYYGAEPQPVFPGPDRRSFTQMEYEIAMELKLPCYVFLCGKNFPFDPHDPEPDEKQALQLAHRDRLLKRDELFYEFATPEELANRTRELQLSVEGLRGELAKERLRRRMTLAACLLLFVVGGGYFYSRLQKSDAVMAETTVQLQKQGDLIARLLAEQDRLRKASAGTPVEIIQLAEQNVAQASKQSLEEVRRAVAAAIATAEAAVAAAQTDPAKLPAALKELADAQRAAGHENEAIDAMQRRLAALDREASPILWAEAADEYAMAIKDRDLMSREPMKILRDALGWAKQNATLGPEHPATLDLMKSLAGIIVDPIEEAIALTRFVLKIRERDLGPEHPRTLESALDHARKLRVSAAFSNNAADGKESEAIFRRVIQTNETRLGPEHPETLSNLLDLAANFSSQKDFAGAETLHQRVLRTREKTLGPDHPDTILSLQLISALREDQKDYPGAIKLIRRALESTERIVGPDDPRTLLNVTILAGLLSRSELPGSLDEAGPLYRRVLETQLRTLGAGQPDTLSSFDSLAWFLEKTGDKEGAKKLTLRRLEEQGKAVGSDDTGYAFQLFLAASNFFIDDENVVAEPLARQCLKIRQAKLGADHPDTIAAASLLSSIQRAPGEPAETERLAQPGKTLPSSKAPSPQSSSSVAEKAPPPLEDYTEFRQDINERIKAGKLARTKLDLPAQAGREHYIEADWSGGKMERAFEWNAVDEKNGTFTLYYFNQHGTLMSIFRSREGVDSPVDGVKKATDTFNFFSRRLATWKRTQDDVEELADPDSGDFEGKGKEVLAAAEGVTAKVRKAGPKPE